MDPGLEGGFIGGGVAIGLAIISGSAFVMSKIWGRASKETAEQKDIAAKIEILGLTMRAEIKDVMTETRAQTVKIDGITSTLSDVRQNAQTHERKDEERFAKVAEDAKQDRHDLRNEMHRRLGEMDDKVDLRSAIERVDAKVGNVDAKVSGRYRSHTPQGFPPPRSGRDEGG